MLALSWVKRNLNRRACMDNLMRVNAATEVCQDRSRWKVVVSAYPFMYVCVYKEVSKYLI